MAQFKERDKKRLVSRISAITGGDLTNREVSGLIDGDLDAITALPAISQQGIASLLTERAESQLEKMVGPTLDFVPVVYLRLARRAADSVARVVTSERRAVGSGVMVSPRLFLTNHHVLDSADVAAEHILQFGYELGDDGVPLPPVEFRLRPSDFYWTSPEAELDATVVAVGEPLSQESELSAFGHCSLSSASDKHAAGDHVTIIQHPDGDFKQVALRENRVLGRGEGGVTLHYGADTLPGSSGSPVFNDQFELVALHHAGGAHNEQRLEDGSAVPPDSNEGIRMSAVVKALRDRHDELPPGVRIFLAEALNPPESVPGAESTRVSRPPTAGIDPAFGTSAEPAIPEAALSRPVGAALQLPLQVSFTPMHAAVSPRGQATGVAERNDAPGTDYKNRRGIDVDFLSVPVELPSAPPEVVGVCARLTEVEADASAADWSGRLLRYHHFASVVRGDRRMPLFTAVDIDGRKLRSINRKTGEVEASETWFVDPRIAPSEQLSQEFFARQQPRIFDRGHLVRRLDPAWGSPVTAKRAADDTFHFANCAPQLLAFNQHLWLGIEDYALENAAAEKQRIKVFSGPVFEDDDPTYRDVAVPRAFWKLVVRVEDASLRVTAFLADQGPQLDQVLTVNATESFAELADVALHQKAVADIELATNLDFGLLRDHDTLGGVESLRGLGTLAEASW